MTVLDFFNPTLTLISADFKLFLITDDPRGKEDEEQKEENHADLRYHKLKDEERKKRHKNI